MISVIIPVYNEEKYLPGCLTSIKNQTIKEPVEIIVVDNNCSDNSASIAKASGAIVVREERSGVGAARKKGVEMASGSIVVTLDADAKPGPEYLAKFIELFNNDASLTCLGGMFSFYDAPLWKNFLRKILARPIYIISYLLSGGKVGPMGNNMGFRLTDYKKTSGFNADLKFGEDMDLVKQLARFGKVKLSFDLPVTASSRRFMFDKNFAEYSFNLLYYLLAGKPWRNRLPKV